MICCQSRDGVVGNGNRCPRRHPKNRTVETIEENSVSTGAVNVFWGERQHMGSFVYQTRSVHLSGQTPECRDESTRYYRPGSPRLGRNTLRWFPVTVSEKDPLTARLGTRWVRGDSVDEKSPQPSFLTTRGSKPPGSFVPGRGILEPG